MMWQPRETAPKDGTAFLAWEPKTDCKISVVRWATEYIEHACFEHVEELISRVVDGPQFTHWMPLPEPPETSVEFSTA